MSASSSATPLPPPLRNTYWVVPGLFLAGEHPGATTREATRERLKRLVAAGVECFVDLTHPAEITAYDTLLPFTVEYLRKPIRDHGLPDKREHMADILDCVHDAMRSGRCVYVHCRAGIGRTGTVVGCLLVERGFTGEEALDELNRLWMQCERSKSWLSVPETEEQVEYVRCWSPRPVGRAGASAAANTATTPPAPDARRATPEHAAATPSAPVSSGPLSHPGTAAATPPGDSDPLLEPATLAAARGLRERFLGALLGLAVGDAVAAATQFRRPGTFTPVGDMLGGGPFDLPRGGWSDDTAMALCLAESLVECDGFNAHDQVERYRRWQQEGRLSSTGQCVGITASTARALAVAQWRRQPFSGSHDPSQLDPEPLSRVAPAVMFFFASSEQAVQHASEASRTTCQAPPVLDACRTFARALHAALSGQPKSVILTAAQGVTETGSGPESRAVASAAEVLSAALTAFTRTDNFRDAILFAANLGGNSDVIAAVCGQLAGAHYGVGAVPAAWRSGLLHQDLVAAYADKLLAHALIGLGA
jgi:ADP-ribosyl-[dinitrogen reductase] hydrolase